MKCYISLFTVFVALKSVYSSITSNLSMCTKPPELNSEECLTKNVDVVLKNLENCNPNLGINLFDAAIADSIKADPSSGPLNFDQMITWKLREHSCAKASEYINENNCKVFSEENSKKINSEGKNKNNTDSEKGTGIGTTALYLYGWLAYRLVFIFLQQI